MLALLPGLLVVRSPWWTVPFLSLAFWELSWWWSIIGGHSRDRFLLAVLCAAGTHFIAARTLAGIEAGRLRPDELAAIERLAATTRPLDIVCAPDGVRDWVPALAGRAVGVPGPWVPPVLREEAGHAPACTVDWIPAAGGR